MIIEQPGIARLHFLYNFADNDYINIFLIYIASFFSEIIDTCGIIT